ncbi:MAG TPA: carboxypeptidase regulatory-like domain-containing protein [Bryobacteraceae bacterium]|nr:carboxypeptidase regulatory-like domain-containing protein [Bryobacteraceae bacterium]
MSLAIIGVASFAAAQSSTGAIKGVLTDDSGASIPAAFLTVQNTAGKQQAQSQADGSYTFPGLQPGDYTLSVTYPGFATFSKVVTVSAGGTVTLPIQLAVTVEKQEITVKGEPGPSVSVEPDNNVGALVIKGDDLMSLPDDPDDLSDALQALAGPGAGPNGGAIYIDGFTGGQLPPKESIREIRINQNPFSAEFDRLGFGRIEILTKPGTDKYHGTAYFNDTDSVWDSRNPFASNKPPYSNRNFGGNGGGPINHRTSFNFDIQRRDIQNNAITNAFYVDPTSYAVSHIQTSLVTPTYNLTITPRIDYAISDKNTLTVRFEERINSGDNQGLGSRALPPGYSVSLPGYADLFPSDLAYNTTGNAQNLMVTETSILSTHLVNETRFQFQRNYTDSLGNLAPEISVANEFTGGGNGFGDKYDTTRHFELTNTSTMTHGTHTMHFGARVRRDSDQNQNQTGFGGEFLFLDGLQQYITTLQLMAQGITGQQLVDMGGGPSKYEVQVGLPYVSYVRRDAAPFFQDDWKVRPNFTLSLGLRYEFQNLIHDNKDWAPRIGFAWAPGSSKNGPPKTVIRGGTGIFYDRVAVGPYESAFLNNGVRQLQLIQDYPTFFPNIPNPGSLSLGTNQTYYVDPKFLADYSMQSAIGVERQLPKSTTVALTYTYNRANHLEQIVPINTPIPGTYNPSAALSPTNGVYPYGYNAGQIEEYESGGFMKQDIVMLSFNTRFSRRISLQGNYSYTHANDLPTTPTNPYNFMQDYGTSNLNRRSNLTIFGTIQAPAKIVIAPNVIVHSGPPYDVTVGTDIYGDNGTARGLFAPSGAACNSPGIYCTPYGDFSTNYTGLLNGTAIPAGLVPRNYLTMPQIVSVNMRIYRTFGFGAKKAGADVGGGPPGGGFGGPGGGGFGGPGGGGRGGGGGMSMGPRGGGGRGGFGGSSDRRFSLTVSANFTNALNHFNPGGYDGVLTSTQFGQATSVNTGYGGGGPGGGAFGGPGGSTANNRRIDLGLRLNF